MTENNLIKKLENLKVPKVETPLHKDVLKQTLLAAHEKKQSKPFIIPNLFINMKKFAPISLLVVALIAGTLYGTNLLSSPIASAQEMIQNAIAKVQQSKMPADQQQKVLAVLEKAKTANDLKFLGEKNTADSGKVKSLSFTDSDGKPVVVDVKESESDEPVILEGQQDENSDATNALQTEEKNETSDEQVKEDESIKPETSASAALTKEVEVKDSTDGKAEVKDDSATETENSVEVKTNEMDGGKESTEASETK